MAKRNKKQKPKNSKIVIGAIKRIKFIINDKPIKYPKCENPYKLVVPNSACVVVSKLGLDKIDNFNLKLNKYAIFDITDTKKPDDKKFIFYRNKVKDLDDIEIKANFGNFDFKENVKKQKKVVEKLFKNHHKEELKTDYRLLIGAEQSIYETSIRLHHIYGIPYIPASAIKGVMRTHFIEKYFYEEEDREKEALSDDDFKYYFGTQDQEGRVIFFDAFPTTKPTIKVDIMNPHYGHYYNDGEAPTDTKNPIPINFLTVEETIFQFLIGFKDEVDSNFVKLFKEALTEHGIGAKTAVGYGYFEGKS